MNNSNMPVPEHAPQPVHFLCRIDRSIADNDTDIDFERCYHIMANSVEEATIKANKFLLKTFPFDHFPNAFFARIEIMDEFLADEEREGLSEQDAEIYKLLSEYTREHGDLPYANGFVYYDGENSERSNSAFIYPPAQVSETTVTEIKNLVALIEVDCFI